MLCNSEYVMVFLSAASGQREKKEIVSPTVFIIKDATQQFDDPFQQAEYAYS